MMKQIILMHSLSQERRALISRFLALREAPDDRRERLMLVKEWKQLVDEELLQAYIYNCEKTGLHPALLPKQGE